jgi:hypothetical protein
MTEREPAPLTIAALDKLDEVLWFESVGRSEFENVVQLHNWSDAADCACSRLSRDFRNERGNLLSESVAAKSTVRFQQWNEIVRIVKPFVTALLHDKADKIISPNGLFGDVLHALNWDILHLCIECEYADLVDPGYFHATAFYYSRGHFPCGVVVEGGVAKRAVF